MSKTRTDSSDAATGQMSQYLTFTLSGDMFALGILAIKEILEYENITAIPMMPACVRGVINLRGAVVPVVDLAARFNRASAPITKRTCIVIVEVRDQSDSQVIGVIVDSVSEVMEISTGDIEPPPAFGSSLRTDFIEGMGKVNGRFIIILDVNHVLAARSLALLGVDGLLDAAA